MIVSCLSIVPMERHGLGSNCGHFSFEGHELVSFYDIFLTRGIANFFFI
jgi:hypothetical protein